MACTRGGHALVLDQDAFRRKPLLRQPTGTRYLFGNWADFASLADRSRHLSFSHPRRRTLRISAGRIAPHLTLAANIPGWPSFIGNVYESMCNRLEIGSGFCCQPSSPSSRVTEPSSRPIWKGFSLALLLFRLKTPNPQDARRMWTSCRSLYIKATSSSGRGSGFDLASSTRQVAAQGDKQHKVWSKV
jgi:hypothetical protein